MKKFRFRLEPILNLRKIQEDQKKREVGTLLAEISRQQNEALALAELIRQQGGIMKQQFITGSVDVNWIASYQGYVSSTQRQIAGKIENVNQIQKKLISARGELAKAAQQTKIMEKLRQKKKDRFDYQLRRQENEQADELANNAFYQRIRLAETVS